VAINSSLMTLGRCLEALRWNQQHRNGGAPLRVVPYRESKVTHLFRDALHGWGHVVLSVNVSPCARDYDETAHVLRYAALATQIGTVQAAAAPRRTIKAKSPEGLRRRQEERKRKAAEAAPGKEGQQQQKRKKRAATEAAATATEATESVACTMQEGKEDEGFKASVAWGGVSNASPALDDDDVDGPSCAPSPQEDAEMEVAEEKEEDLHESPLGDVLEEEVASPAGSLSLDPCTPVSLATADGDEDDPVVQELQDQVQDLIQKVGWKIILVIVVDNSRRKQQPLVFRQWQQ
jgi:hypothetical protein